MNLAKLLQTRNLNRSLLIGYYGGGNYGDELLLEVLANLLKAKGYGDITITYQQPASYKTFHHNFGYRLIKMDHKPSLLRAILKNRNIIIGGGGLWGLDVNPNILLLSTMLFVSRWLLGKKVYLLGVGYYNSTSKTGRVSAWLAGKAATHIVARDQETMDNFLRVTSHVGLDTDMAWYLQQLDPQPYAADVQRLEQTVHPTQKTLFITLRRFKAEYRNDYAQHIQNCLAANTGKPIILSLLEPETVDPDGFAQAKQWAAAHPNIQVIDFSYNPIALYLFFKKHAKHLVLAGPQFHIIITAHLAGVPFLPVVYDNKVSALFGYIGQKTMLPIKTITQADIQRFIDQYFARPAKRVAAEDKS